jgi:hypothetical protein
VSSTFVRVVLGRRAAMLLLGLTSCTPQPASTATAPTVPTGTVARVDLDLAAYLPGAGFSWIIQLHPRRIAAQPALLAALDRTLPAERRRAFVAETAADPERIDEVWWGRYALGELWLVDGREVGTELADHLRARARSASALRVEQGLSEFTFVRAEVPCSALFGEGKLFALAEGDPSLTRIVRARALGKLSRSPAALDTVHLAPLAHLDEDSLVRVFTRGTGEGAPWLAGIAAASAAFDLEGADLRARLNVLGAWEARGPTLAAELTRVLLELVDAPEARALGTGTRSLEPQFTCAPVESSDPRILDLDLCRAELRVPLERWSAAIDWIGARHLGALTEKVGGGGPSKAPSSEKP